LFFAVPFAALLVVMFSGYTPQFAAACAIVIAALLLLTGTDLAFNPLRTRERLMQAAITAGRQISMIASIILCASIIVGVLGMTGLGVKITSGILAFSADSLWMALIADSACLHHPWHGGANYGGLCHLRFGRRPGIDRHGRGTTPRSSVYLLVCAAVDHHTAGLWRRFHRC
jgi:hypothetical protein